MRKNQLLLLISSVGLINKSTKTDTSRTNFRLARYLPETRSKLGSTQINRIGFRNLAYSIKNFRVTFKDS